MNPIVVLLLITTTISTLAQPPKEILYVGTYSVRGSEGIYVVEFDPKGATLKVIQAVPGPESPTYVEIHPSAKFLYAAYRGSVDGVSKEHGSISSYSIDRTSGKLKFINNVPSFGLGSCHIAINSDGKFAVISQFHEGTLAVHELKPDGSLGNMTDSTRYKGQGLDVKRQAAPHIHSANFTPDGRSILVADLGTDKLYSYSSKIQDGKLVPSKPPSLSTQPGTGPRHITFHPNGKNFYLAEEISNTVAVFALDEKTGAPVIVQDMIATLPTSFTGTNSAADIHTSPDGKFLYMSNRGHDALAIFRIDKNGGLKLIAHQDVMGKVPRFLMFNKSGEFLFVANQDSDNVVIFKVDKKTGFLKAGGSLTLPSPVCVKELS